MLQYEDKALIELVCAIIGQAVDDRREAKRADNGFALRNTTKFFMSKTYTMFADFVGLNYTGDELMRIIDKG